MDNEELLKEIRQIVDRAAESMNQKLERSTESMNQKLERAAETTNQKLERAAESTNQKLERAAEAMTLNLTDLRQEMIRRFEGIERRLDLVENNTGSMLMQLAGINRSLTAGERADYSMSLEQSAQKRAIDELAARVTKIEQRLNP